MIEAKNITKVFSLGDDKVRALDGVSLRIQDGEMVSIMGPSGSGKSTLMAILGCLDTPTTGEYLVDDLPVARLKEIQFQPASAQDRIRFSANQPAAAHQRP
jgi:putative ABC transport system ATP-binding protein